MNELLVRAAWIKKPDEDSSVFEVRKNAQTQQLRTYINNHGNCYMVKFGPDDVRPMWEDTIIKGDLKEEIKLPFGIPVECPLCQPYDDESGNRRYLTRIINPKYSNGCIDEGGVFMKCVCIKKGEHKKRLKFKEKENATQPTKGGHNKCVFR